MTILMKRARLGITCLTFLLGLLTADLVTAEPSIPTQVIEQSRRISISESFSFVGADSVGHVAMVLDTHRGRDGETFQAEHDAVLHDEHEGWIEVTGSGRYENVTRELLSIPDSPVFRFQGSPETGLTITSEKNGLHVQIDPLRRRYHRQRGDANVWMGSAGAVLTWKGRTVSGRVIYEQLLIPDVKRLTRTSFGLRKQFQGLYLLANRAHDLYVHSQRSAALTPLIGRVAGFVVWDEETEILENLAVKAMHHDLALGLYRWPTEWKITWHGPKGPGALVLVLSHRKRIKNWIIGGFSVGIIRGEVTYNGITAPVYGFAQLSM